MINFLKCLISVVWQLPQNVLGFLIELTNFKTLKYYDGYDTVKHLGGGGISLGEFIIFDADRIPIEKDIRHEKGHQKQSLYLGWLYLIVIGIPSFCGNCYDRLFHKNWTPMKRYRWYYSQPWEKWADELGGVQRL